MILIDDQHILFIEPKKRPSTEPIVDDLYERMYYAYNNGKDADYRYRGVHRCTGEGCEERSTNTDRILRTGEKTNSLCMHYLAHHRDEVPKPELEKVARLPKTYRPDWP